MFTRIKQASGNDSGMDDNNSNYNCNDDDEKDTNVTEENFDDDDTTTPKQQLDDDDNDDDDSNNDYINKEKHLSLKQILGLACKYIDIGTAVLPHPLFDLQTNSSSIDNNEDTNTNLNHNHHHYQQQDKAPTTYAKIIQHEFNAVVIEHHLKWAPLVHSEPGPLPPGIPIENRFGRYDFYYADMIVDWCIQNNINKIKGHVLVWHVTTPKFIEDLEPDMVREQLRRHIFTCMSHFHGRIKSWDVVNEALAPDGSLAENVFYRKLGPSYIEECFRWAHEANPNAILLYNDNKVEGIGTPKSDGFYNLLADLKAKNVPIHGCGIQAHFNAAGTGVNRIPSPASIKQQIRRLGNLGLSVNISEMDVRVSKLPSNSDSDMVHIRSVAQRQIYHDVIAAAISEPAFDGIWLWGYTDRHTWVHSFYYDDEPCIYDENYKKKPAYYGVRDALLSITPGHVVGGRNVVLDSDLDIDGNPWGYQWMQPEPTISLGNGERMDQSLMGDARPDWEHQPDERNVVIELDNDNNVNDGNDTTLLVDSSHWA